MTRQKQWQAAALTAGILGAIAAIAGLVMHVALAIFFRAYLFGYLFCLGLALGSLCLQMIHNLTGGDWGNRVAPLLSAAARSMPMFVLLFIPICLGLPSLYPWARPEDVGQDAVLAHRQPYLNVPFFVVRAAVYFAVWIIWAILMNRRERASRAISAAGLILYLLTMTHAGIDWIMSRDTEFYSTAFGFILTVGQTLSALAFAVALLPWIPTRPALPTPRASSGFMRHPLLNDLGSLLMTLVVLWAYVSFMQLLVIWMGNAHEDNTWYLQRGLGSGGDSTAWRIVGASLLLFHFLVPFYILLFRRAKQNEKVLRGTALVLLSAHVLEQYWLVAPSGRGAAARFDPSWPDVALPLGLLGLWMFLFLWLLKRPGRAALPPAPDLEAGAPAYE